MTPTLHITFHGLDSSQAVEDDIRKQVTRLERLHPRITRCQVSIELPHRHHHQGNVFRVRVDVTVPGAELVVGHDPGVNHAHEDVYVAIRDAFNAVARQLEDVVRRPRAERHPHEPPLRGCVTRVTPDHGFLVTDDGLDVYFHRNSVLDNRFDRVEVGNLVRIVVSDSEGIKGPQATTVELLS